jgi:hypothetical protein
VDFAEEAARNRLEKAKVSSFCLSFVAFAFFFAAIQIQT